MLIIMEDRIELFVHGLKRWAKTKPHRKTQGELAAVIGKSQPTISDYFNFKYAPEPKDINLWVVEFGLDEDEIVDLGRIEKRRVERTDSQEINMDDYKDQVIKIVSEHANVVPIDQKHADIIRRFRNKELAVAVNQELLEIEALDPAELKSILRDLRAKKRIIQEEQESERKKRENGSDSRE